MYLTLRYLIIVALTAAPVAALKASNLDPNTGINVPKGDCALRNAFSGQCVQRHDLGLRGAMNPNSSVGDRSIVFESSVYRGEILNNKPHGKGVFEFSDGSKYEGNFFLGTYKGQGTYLWPNGTKYVGEWINNAPNGLGTISYAGEFVGHRYQGTFNNGVPHGRGTYFYSNGDKIEGEFADGFANGAGDYYHANGTKSSGQFRDGFLDGKVTQIYADGGSREGEFKDGNFAGPVNYRNPQGEWLIETWSNGRSDAAIDMSQFLPDEDEKVGPDVAILSSSPEKKKEETTGSTTITDWALGSFVLLSLLAASYYLGTKRNEAVQPKNAAIVVHETDGSVDEGSVSAFSKKALLLRLARDFTFIPLAILAGAWVLAVGNQVPFEPLRVVTGDFWMVFALLPFSIGYWLANRSK